MLKWYGPILCKQKLVPINDRPTQQWFFYLRWIDGPDFWFCEEQADRAHGVRAKDRRQSSGSTRKFCLSSNSIPRLKSKAPV